jgi:hypothetical protein
VRVTLATPAKVLQTLIRPAAPLPPACQPDVPACMLRVTAAPAPSYAGSVVHVAALRASERLCHSARAEHTQPPCLQWDGAWLGVYCVTGCTADSSREESGAWWWHRSSRQCSASHGASMDMFAGAEEADWTMWFPHEALDEQHHPLEVIAWGAQPCRVCHGQALRASQCRGQCAMRPVPPSSHNANH